MLWRDRLSILSLWPAYVWGIVCVCVCKYERHCCAFSACMRKEGEREERASKSSERASERERERVSVCIRATECKPICDYACFVRVCLFIPV